MESAVETNSQSPTSDSANMDQHYEDAEPEHSNHGDAEPTIDVSVEERRSIIEDIAATGKYWHDWSFLKRLLSLQLKQALAEYPEAQTTSEIGLQQSSLSGETYSELVRRLDEALLIFEGGPPFTLQRLCEILLHPKGTYTKLSKLALALEKNLLVTSTLTKCTDPYPSAAGQWTEGTNVEPERPLENPIPASNGTDTVAGDVDEEMADAEAADASANHDTEMQEDKTNETPTADPKPDSTSTTSAEANSDGNHSSNPQS